MVLTVAAVVVAVACIRLGFWQLDRLHGRKDANRAIAAAEARPAEPFASMLAGTEDPLVLRFRRASITGRYDPSHEVLLYGRNAASTGEAGDQVLTPLVLPDGSAIVVDRGWVPIESTVPLQGALAAPTGEVRIEGVLFPPDAVSTPTAGASPAVNVTKVDLGQLAAQMPYRLQPLYVLLQVQDPPQSGPLPEMPPLPPFTNGPHFSYAVQWFSFAAITIVGYGVVLRRSRVRARTRAAVTGNGEGGT